MERLDFFAVFGMFTKALSERNVVMEQYYIGFCVINELDGSQMQVEIVLKAWTDEEAEVAFRHWKGKYPTDYDGRRIIGKPGLYCLRKVA